MIILVHLLTKISSRLLKLDLLELTGGDIAHTLLLVVPHYVFDIDEVPQGVKKDNLPRDQGGACLIVFLVFLCVDFK